MAPLERINILERPIYEPEMIETDVSDYFENLPEEEKSKYYVNGTLLDHNKSPEVKRQKIEKLKIKKTGDAVKFDEVGQYPFRFTKYAEMLWDRRTWDDDLAYRWSLDKNGTRGFHVFPYRYGSYYVFEANNKTNQFKVATFINITSHEVANFYPQYLYDAIIKTATGYKDFKFMTTNVPWPKEIRSSGHRGDASGIFLAFVAGISFALIPASIISRIVHEKEIGLL